MHVTSRHASLQGGHRAPCHSYASSAGIQSPAASYQPTLLGPHSDTAGRQEWASQQAERPWMSGFSALALLLVLCSWCRNSICLSNLWSIKAVPSTGRNSMKLVVTLILWSAYHPLPSLLFDWLQSMSVYFYSATN